jgi:oligopeptide transport system permease protein
MSLGRRITRDLLLVPLVAVLVHGLVAHLPVRQDGDAKVRVTTAVQRELRDRLCADRWDGFLCPWGDLVHGRALADEGAGGLYDAPLLAHALAGSLRIGALALLLAMVFALGFALVRSRPLPPWVRASIDGWPALVFATPTFLVALAVARFVGVSLDDDKLAFEPVAACVLSLGPGALFGVLLHGALARETPRPYVATARAKGLSARAALVRHALPNALPALLDALPPVATGMLAGSFVVERLFNVTYLGFIYVEAARQKQLAVVVVTTTLFAALLVLVSLATDLAKAGLLPTARRR